MGDMKFSNRICSFCTNTIFDKKEYQDYDEGKLLAYNEMLSDVKVMAVNEFVSNDLEQTSIHTYNQKVENSFNTIRIITKVVVFSSDFIYRME